MPVLQPFGSLHCRLPGSTKRAGPSVAVGVLVGQKSGKDKPPSLDQLLLSVSLCVRGQVLPFQALIDSGAQDSLLDQELALQVGTPALSLHCYSLGWQGHRPGHSQDDACYTHHLRDAFGANLLLAASRTLRVLGYPRLRHHNPTSTGCKAKW